MEKVKHGRRKGQARNSPVGSRTSKASLPPVQGSMLLPDGTDLRQVTVLSKSDWSRIAAQLERKQREEEAIRKRREAKEALHKETKEIVKNWSNTIAGQRLKKLEARKIREEKEEAERVQIDIEEAKYQAQKRKEAIEKAKTLQYYQTDRVKGFHGALMLTEVLKEREAQIELKKKREEAGKGKDKELLMRALREMEEAVLADQEKAMQRLKERKDISEFQKQQVLEHIQQAEIDKIQDVREGQELKRSVDHYNAERAKIERIRLGEKQDLMKSHLKTVADRDLIRAAQQQQEEEEEEEIRIFAAAKKKMTKLRRARERELWQQKQDHVNNMVNELDSQLKAKKDDEDDRIAKAVAEREAHREKEMKEKEERLQEDLRQISIHRDQQMKQKEQEEREERRRELEALHLKMEADRLFATKQEQKMQQIRQEAHNLREFHGKQIVERQDKDLVERAEQLEMDKKNIDLLAVEEQQFQEYAGRVINHCKEGGRNVYPLQKAAREGHGGGHGPVFEGKGGIRPSYLTMDRGGIELPNYQKASTEEVKYAHVGKSSNTTKRLGFVW
ncbi:cilia- and flagella- associated protein 210-like [Diadema antillarum]|uniref:cilia- and flagella- associated protein 210-like n=1 Tax=Diadema antillarum TaxID=105358 RepID=UPI003A88816B